MNAYMTPQEFMRYTTGLNVADCIGNSCHLSISVLAGALSITITPALTTGLNPYDLVSIFDGASTEQVSVTSATPAGATSIPCSPCAFSHMAGTVACSDGTSSLAQCILDASDELENICQQPRLFATYTDTYTLPSMRASYTQDGTFVVRPRVFPVVSVVSASLSQQGITTPLTIGASVIEAGGKVVSIPLFSLNSSLPQGSMPFWIQNPQMWQSVNMVGTLILQYTAGYPLPVPGHIRKATMLLTANLLAMRMNPGGFVNWQAGRIHFITGQSSDNTGSSNLYKQAQEALKNDIQKAM